MRNMQICPHCGAEAIRRNIENAVETVFDPFIGRTITQKKHVPVLISYKIGSITSLLMNLLCSGDGKNSRK